MNPLRLPRRARDLTGRACAPLRERAYDAWLQPRRRSVAALLRLTVAGGWLLDAALDAALDDPAPNTALYRLLDEALSGLPIWMEATARRSVLDATRMPNWAPFATLTLLKSEAECHLFLALEHLWPHTFHLDDLPPALAVAVAQTLSLIGTHLTECVLARDLAEGWADEAAAAYHEIKALGHTDPADRWGAVCDNAAWSGLFGWNDSDEFEGWWAQQAAFYEPMHTPTRRKPFCRRWRVRWKRLFPMTSPMRIWGPTGSEKAWIDSLLAGHECGDRALEKSYRRFGACAPGRPVPTVDLCARRGGIVIWRLEKCETARESTAAVNALILVAESAFRP